MSYPNGGQPGEQGQWGQPQGSQQTWGQSAASGFNNAKTSSGFDVKNVRPGQWIALILPLFSILAMSLNFVGGGTESSSAYGQTYTYDIPGFSAWNSGLFVFMFILFLFAAIAAAVEMFVPSLNLPFPMAFVTGGLLALGALLGLIEWLTSLDAIDVFSIGAWLVLLAILAAIAGAVLEIMHALKQPKTGGTANAQWGQPAGQGQWGAPATGGQPAVQQGQWGQPQTGGHVAQPQGQWGQPNTGGHPAQPQQGQWGQNPQQGQPGQWGQQG